MLGRLHWLGVIVGVAGAASLAFGAVSDVVGTKISIASAAIGAPPADFEFNQTGPGAGGEWAIVGDPSAATGAAIEQASADETDDRYPLAIYNPLSVKNLDLSARVKILKGRMRSAGIALRVENSLNYYLVRISALEGRVDFYKFVDGQSERIAGTEADVLRDRWYTIAVRTKDDRFAVALDGAPLFTVFDRDLPQDGRVALWTEEDNITRIDEIVITALAFSAGD